MMRFQRAKRPETVTIVILDWDDTVVGEINVPKGSDARAALNEYIKTHLIHPQLRDGVDHTSLDRVMTYRGQYPAEGPKGSLTVEDGAQYPFTNKLDYVYVKGQITQTAPPTEERDGAYTIEDPDPNDPYPFIHGLAIVRDRSRPTWTTMGVGELGNYTHKKRSGNE